MPSRKGSKASKGSQSGQSGGLLPMEMYPPDPETRCNKCNALKHDNKPCSICGSPEFRIIRFDGTGRVTKEKSKNASN